MPSRHSGYGPRRRSPLRDGPYQGLIVVGRHSSGKSTFARALAGQRDAQVIELGDGVRREAARLQETSLVQMATQLLNWDPLYLADYALRRVRAPSVIFVGPRTQVEIDHLRKGCGITWTIGIDTPTDLRFQRWRQRHLRYTDSWQARELQESTWRVEALVTAADIVLAPKTLNALSPGEILSLLPPRIVVLR